VLLTVSGTVTYMFRVSRKWRVWFYGLSSAFIGGAASSMKVGLALIIVAPESFNLSDKLLKTLLTVLVLGAIHGGELACAFLMQSPLARTEDETDFVVKPKSA
jgi:hypothetical protein